MLRYKTPNT